jgi:hypothetical protein
MTFTLTIQGETHELPALLEKLNGTPSENGQPVEEPKTRKQRIQKDASPVAPPTVEKIDDGLGEEEPPVVHTIESIRALGREEAKRVGPDKVRALVKELGFDKLPDMTPDKFGEFAEKVVKLTK